MANLNNYSYNQLQQYSHLVKRATKYGVPIDMIIEETRKYHGNDFADIIINNIKQ